MEEEEQGLLGNFLDTIHGLIHEEALSTEEGEDLIDSATDENGHIDPGIVKEIMDELS